MTPDGTEFHVGYIKNGRYDKPRCLIMIEVNLVLNANPEFILSMLTDWLKQVY